MHQEILRIKTDFDTVVDENDKKGIVVHYDKYNHQVVVQYHARGKNSAHYVIYSIVNREDVDDMSILLEVVSMMSFPSSRPRKGYEIKWEN